MPHILLREKQTPSADAASSIIRVCAAIILFMRAVTTSGFLLFDCPSSRLPVRKTASACISITGALSHSTGTSASSAGRDMSKNAYHFLNMLWLYPAR